MAKPGWSCWRSSGSPRRSAGGSLTIRSNVAAAPGERKALLTAVNELLDAALLPIGEGNRILDQIAHGKVDELIAQTYQGDHEKMKQNVNGIAVVLQKFQTELGKLTEFSRQGQLEKRGDAAAFQGAYGEVIKGVNEMLDAILIPIGEGNRILDQIAHGKVDELIAQTYRGDHEKMKQNVNGIAVVLQKFQAELAKLTEFSRQGQLEKRGDAGGFQGAYGEVIKGVNEMLDAILLPIGEGNRILDQIAHGKIDELIAQTYKGDHEKMKQNVNGIALVLQKFQAELAKLTEFSRQGQLDKRGDAAAFQGAYGEIIKGVNEMLDAILLPIGEGNRILRLISGGNLKERVEIDCKGDHQRMKEAVNGVQSWLKGLIAYVTAIATGDMTARMDKASDDDQIHEWLMLLKANIANVVGDADTLVKAAAEGKLSVRADATHHHGEYRRIVEGLNNTLEAVVGAADCRQRLYRPHLQGRHHQQDQPKLQRRLQPADAKHQYAGRQPDALRPRSAGGGRPGGHGQRAVQRVGAIHVAGRHRAGIGDRGSLGLDGADGRQHQAERRQRQPDREDRRASRRATRRPAARR